MTNELPQPVIDLIVKVTSDKVENELNKRIALWRKWVFGTTTISVLGFGALLIAVYESARSSATLLVRQEVTERIDQTMKAVDLPNVILKHATTLAQETTEIAARCKVATELAERDANKVLAQLKSLDEGQEALRHATSEQWAKVDEIMVLMNTAKNLDTAKLANKAVELDKLMKDKPNAEKLATLLGELQNTLNVNFAVVEVKVGAPQVPTHRFYPLRTNGVGNFTDKAINGEFPIDRQAEAGAAFGSQVVACWIDVPAYLHHLYGGSAKWSRLDARIVDGNRVEIVTSAVGGVPAGIECRVFVVYRK